MTQGRKQETHKFSFSHYLLVRCGEDGLCDLSATDGCVMTILLPYRTLARQWVHIEGYDHEKLQQRYSQRASS